MTDITSKRIVVPEAPAPSLGPSRLRSGSRGGEDSGIRSRLPAVGTVVDGKYRIEEYVGRGSVGCVARAFHLQREADVALKFLAHRGPSGARLPERFRREAIATSRVKTAHVAEIFDLVEPPGELPFLVMEYLVGVDLRHELRGGPLSLERSLHICIQALRALDAAHTAGVVHRDLKPANIFLISRDNEGDFVKVVDFGLSKLEETVVRHTRLTQGDVAMGTPHYMAPEQARDAGAVTAAADIYSAAAVLFECLTGHPPLTAGSTGELFVKLLNETPPRVDEVVSGIPTPIADIIARALSKSARTRPSPRELASVLAEYAGPGSRPFAAWLSEAPTVVKPLHLAPPAAAASRPATRRSPIDPIMLGFLGGLAFALTFLLGIWAFRLAGVGG